MMLLRRRCLAAFAVLATLTMVVAAPLHASHHHDDSASAMHPSCAICQMHAPAGTPPDTRVTIVEPDRTGHFADVHRDALHPDPHCRIDACRAPPVLLAA